MYLMTRNSGHWEMKLKIATLRDEVTSMLVVCATEQFCFASSFRVSFSEGEFPCHNYPFVTRYIQVISPLVRRPPVVTWTSQVQMTAGT